MRSSMAHEHEHLRHGHHATAEEKASLAASIAQAERGEFASDEAIEAMWAKYGA